MLNVRAHTIVASLGIAVLVAACSGNGGGHKVKLNRGISPRDGGSDWVKDVLYTESAAITTPAPASNPTPTTTKDGRKIVPTPSTNTTTTRTTTLSCLSARKLVDAIVAAKGDEAAKRELISVTAFDLDFVTAGMEAVNPKSKLERLVVKPEGTALLSEIQKANYFFRVRKEARLSQLESAANLLASPLGKELLNVIEQVKCDTAIFLERAGNGTPVTVPYKIVSYDNRRIVLQKQTEALPGPLYRVYQLDGKTQVRISLIIKENAIPVCGATDTAVHTVKYDYLLSRSRDLEKIQISKGLAGLFSRFVFSTPELDDKAPVPTATPERLPQPAGSKKRKGKREQSGHVVPGRMSMRDRTLVTSSTYGYLLALVNAGQAAKNVACSGGIR